MSETLRAVPDFFKKAQDMHPDYQAGTILHLYQRVVFQVAKASGCKIEDLPPEIVLNNSEKRFIEELGWKVLESKTTHDFQPITSFLQLTEIPWNKTDVGELNPEFLLFATTLKEGIQPILESAAFGKEYKVTRESFLDLIDGIVDTFASSNRVLFAFHAGEVFKAKDFYMRGKTLGLSNAATLGLRNLVRRGPF